MVGTAVDRSQQGNRARRGAAFFERTLAHYRHLTNRALLKVIPEGGPPHLYDLVGEYPRRFSKGLRPALCLATCAALGGSEEQALSSAVVIELLHNAFLIFDDVQDESLMRRKGMTLPHEHGIGVAVNVGNATSLLALQRLIDNRGRLGPALTWRIVEETERTMRHSLEGQAIEIGWIRDQVYTLTPFDYLRMCLKKTSWYSFIYPLCIGALVARGPMQALDRFHRFGWYVGAAFQIRDDILNLTGRYARYGKEIGGDLWEGKRTLMLIHLLDHCSAKERERLKAFLATARAARTETDVKWIYGLMGERGSIEFARRAAQQLCGAALLEALTLFREVPDSVYKRFILEMVLYVASRDR